MIAHVPRLLRPDGLDHCRVSGSIIIMRRFAIVVVAGPFRGDDDDGRPVYFVHAAGDRPIVRVRSSRAAWRIAWRFARVLDRYEQRRPLAVHQHHPAAPGNVRWRLTPAGRPVPVIQLDGGRDAG